ncbi:MAG: MarR family transcriptional regulator [Anaerolineae bacterium]|nr:MarR family transcriptional regulator [Anaerolineae bacterium]
MKPSNASVTTFEIFILGAVISRIVKQSTKHHTELADEGMTLLQYGVLRLLSHQNLTIAELSKLMMVDPSTLVPVIDTLERKELTCRTRDPEDRRRVPVTITDRGKAVISRHQDHGPFSPDQNPLVQSIDALGKEKAQQLLTLLREVVGNLPEGDDILKHVNARVEFHTTGIINHKIFEQD